MARSRIVRDIDFNVNGTSSQEAVSKIRDWALGTAFNNPQDTLTFNRTAIIAVYNEDSSGGSIATSLSVGSQTATKLQSVLQQAGFSNEVAFFSLNEAQLTALGENETISVTFSNANDVFTVASAVYANVRQANPVIAIDTANGISVSGSITLTAASEEEGVSLALMGRGDPGNWTTPTANYTEVADLTNTGGECGLFENLTPSASSQSFQGNISGTANRVACILLNLRKA